MKDKEEISSETDIVQKETVGYFDMFLSKIISRKLLAWIVATILLCKENIHANDWVAITLLWIGVQGTIDWYRIYVNNKS